jgi:hypothetical protein
MSHAYFVAEYANSSTFASGCLGRLNLKLLVDFLFKAFKCVNLVRLAVFLRFSDTLVIKTTFLCQGEIRISCCLELSYRFRLGYYLSREHSQLSSKHRAN